MRLFSVSCAVVLTCACVLPVRAQVRKSSRVKSSAPTTTVGVPVLGFVAANSGKEVRPVWGHRSAAGLGPALSLPADAENVVLAPSGTAALVATPSGWHILSLESYASRVLNDENAAGGMAAFNRSGSHAAIVLPGTQTVRVYQGLPDAPSTVFSADISGLQMPVVAAALSGDGGIALLGTSDGRNGSLYVVRDGSLPVEIAQTGQVSAIRFLRDGHTAIVADRLWSNLLIVDTTNQAAPRVFADSTRNVDGPADITVDEARNRIFVANSAGRTVLALSLNGEQLMHVSCPFEPTRIAALNSSGLVAVTSPQTDSVWVLRPDAPHGQLTFLSSLQ
jgi:hypothetical protein